MEVHMIKEIIEIYNDRDTSYGSGMTNHLNMGLFALSQLGAEDEQLNRYAKHYIAHAELKKAPVPNVRINRENFNLYLGDRTNYSAYVVFFKDVFGNLEFGSNDFTTLLEIYVNELIDGAAGGAFHGLIRLAYAYELQSEEEICKALAYLAECYMKMGETSDILALDEKEPMNAMMDLSEVTYFQEMTFSRAMITGRMRDVFEDPMFMMLATKLPDQYLNSESFHGLLINIYGMTQNFTMLHAYTSTHALRVLEPLIENYEDALQRHWFNLQIAYLSTNCTPFVVLPKMDIVPSWGHIFTQALHKTDVHTIKVIYSMFDQTQIFGEGDLGRMLAVIRLNQNEF